MFADPIIKMISFKKNDATSKNRTYAFLYRENQCNQQIYIIEINDLFGQGSCSVYSGKADVDPAHPLCCFCYVFSILYNLPDAKPCLCQQIITFIKGKLQNMRNGPYPVPVLKFSMDKVDHIINMLTLTAQNTACFFSHLIMINRLFHMLFPPLYLFYTDLPSYASYLIILQFQYQLKLKLYNHIIIKNSP